MYRLIHPVQRMIAWIALGILSLNADDRVQVVTTFTIPADWVSTVGGERVEQSVLVGRNTDMHTFDETPRDLMNLQGADIIVAIGLELEPWLPRLLKASATKGKLIYLSEVLHGVEPSLLLAGGGECTSMHSPEGAHTLHVHEIDPHVWLDPKYAALMVERIEQVLAEVDPQYAEDYSKRGRAYRTQLQQLDAEVSEQLAQVAEDQRVLIAHHDTLRYFARAYGFRVPGSILGTVTIEGTEPSARQIVQILDLIRHEKVAAVFAENSLPVRLVNQVAREAGLPQPKVLYTGALGEKGSPGESYLSMMRYNAEAILESLGI